MSSTDGFYWLSWYDSHWMMLQKPSVFPLVKSSLDCRLWHRCIDLLEDLHDPVNCCVGIFLLQRNNSCHPLHLFSVCLHGLLVFPELISAFFLFKNAPRSRFGQTYWSLWWVCWFFQHNGGLLHWLSLESLRVNKQIPPLKSTLDILTA